MKRILFDPHKSFLCLGVFWAVIAAHTIIAMLITCLIIYNSNLEPNFTYTGLNNALNIFKIPLGIMALIIPIVALLAANHRSEQTKEQIKTTLENNNFSNHYKHIAEFESYVSEHSEETVKISLPRKFHRLAFPDANLGKFRVSEKTNIYIESFLNNFIKTSSGLNSPGWQRTVLLLDRLINQYAESFYIKNYKDTSGNILTVDGEQVLIPDGTIKNFIIPIRTISIKIRDALLFDDRYEPSHLLTRIINFDYDKIPHSDIKNISRFSPFDFEALLSESDINEK